MEERRLLNNPGRISDADGLSPTRFGVPGESSHRLSEVYGFISSITIVVATGALIIWAYVPEYWLHSVGIYYYPRRYWALPLPTYVMISIILAIGVYIGLNFLNTPPPTSLKTMFDEFSKDLLVDDVDVDDPAVVPFSDVGNNKVNELLNDLS